MTDLVGSFQRSVKIYAKIWVLIQIPVARPVVSYLMCVDAHVSDGAGEVLVLAVVDVAPGLRVDVLLGQPEVHHVDDVPVAVGETAHQAVFRLNEKDSLFIEFSAY